MFWEPKVSSLAGGTGRALEREGPPPPVSLKGSEKNGSRPVEPVSLLGPQNDAAEISLLILQKGTLGERAPILGIPGERGGRRSSWPGLHLRSSLACPGGIFSRTRGRLSGSYGRGGMTDGHTPSVSRRREGHIHHDTRARKV